MNERIKILREQALRWSGENVNRNLYSNYEIEQKEYEKFAELIVRECNRTVLEVPCYYKDYRSQIEEAVINDCARAVLEHFGVE